MFRVSSRDLKRWLSTPLMWNPIMCHLRRMPWRSLKTLPMVTRLSLTPPATWMIYMNMGHGDKIFIDATLKMLIINGLRWLVASDNKGNVFEK
jgi:hypothetical protein